MHCVVRAVKGIKSAYDTYILVRTQRASGHLTRVGNFIPLPSFSVVFCVLRRAPADAIRRSRSSTF